MVSFRFTTFRCSIPREKSASSTCCLLLGVTDKECTKRFVLDVAKEIKIESAAKQRFIKEWLGTELTIEELFPVEQ